MGSNGGLDMVGSIGVVLSLAICLRPCCDYLKVMTMVIGACPQHRAMPAASGERGHIDYGCSATSASHAESSQGNVLEVSQWTQCRRAGSLS